MIVSRRTPVLAGGLVLAAALFFAPGAAQAVNDCGALNSGNSFTETCPGAAYTGIVYWDQANPVRITVTGTTTTAATTITAGANNGLHNGITIRTSDDMTSPRTSPVRNIALTVGGMGTVAIGQYGTRASSWYNNRGIFVLQRDGDGATTTVDVKSGVTIGTAMTKMESRGIEVRAFESDAGAVTVTSAAVIYSEDDGIYVENPGDGAVTVTNTGAITTDGRGIYVADSGSAGAITVTNSGAITSANTTNDEGIFARTTGKDADDANAGASVTHSAGAIAVTAGGVGIKAEVGAARQEGDATHDDYVAPMNAGLAKVSVTGGSINAKQGAIQARNYEAGSVEVSVSESVTLASTEGHGIEAALTDVGNTAGTISVTNAATITAGTRTTISAGMTTRTVKHGINVNRAAGSGAVTVANRGAVTADGYGISAVARGAGGTVSVTNSGTLGTAEDRVSRGIFISHQGTGATGAVTVANSGAIASSGDGIFARMTGKDAADANAGVTVTHSAGAIASADGRGIKVHVGEARQETDTSHDDYVAPRNRGLLKVEVTGGSINSKWEPIEAYNYEAGSVEVRVSEGVTLTSTHGHGIWGGLTDAGNASGTITIDNAGTIRVPKSGITFAIGAGSGDITVNNRGALEVGGDGIFAVARAGVTGDIRVTNSGAIGKADARVRRGIFASHDGTGATGGVTVTNSGDIMATKQGILAQTKFLDADGADDEVTVTHSAGTINVTDDGRVDSDKQGIVARVGNWRQERDSSHADYVAPKNTGAVKINVTGGTIAAKGSAVEGANYEAGNVEINVAKGVTLSSTHEHAIEADLRDVGNAGGTITVTQAGTISASGDGISAKVTRRDAVAAPGRPVIDIVWTGTFTALEGEPGSPRNVARAVEAAQGRRAVEEANIRFARGSAGIDAGVMKWQTFMRPVSEGDDPGAFADKAAQDALFAEGADAATKARAEAIIERFRSVLTDETLGTIPGADAIDADDDGDYHRREIVAYLSEDDDARRTLLRNVLTQSFTEDEMAVFRAVLTDGDVEAALAAAPAGYGDAWKTGVRALLAHHNNGDIRIAMNAGSITSSGDGIRAFFGRTHDDNGAIRIDVAEGATVTGGVAGIYVENAGHGLRIEKKYTSPAVQEANEDKGPDDLLTLAEHHDQIVTVNGTVTGGTDVAVHLAGGGALIVGRTGKLVAGSSGRAVLVNHPGPAAVYIEGEATGGEGAPAAVHLTGGGSVTVASNGRVRANGADSAIRGDKPTVVVLHTEALTQEGTREAEARVEGGIVGDGVESAILALVKDGVTTGDTESVPIEKGRLVLDSLSRREFTCAMAGDGRCRLYEALPSVLLSMNGLPTRADRLSAAQDGQGGWARVETARGEWKADSSTQPGVAYDHHRHGVRAGVDFPVGESSRLGASVHGLQGSAKTQAMAGRQGEIELSGMGAGVNATATTDDGIYVDAQVAVTWYEADITSSTHTVPLKDGVKGLGLGAGLEAGLAPWRAGEGVSLTPRAGLVWSKVALDDFTDEVSSARVSVEDALSVSGRAGLAMEASGGEGVRLFGSVDAVHEFSEETSVDVSGSTLKASGPATSVRFGLGGAFALGRGTSLRVAGDYTAGGSDTSAWGGALNLTVHF